MISDLQGNERIAVKLVVGDLIVNWGYIDAQLAQLCKSLHEDLGGHSSWKRPNPSLEKRLEFVGKCFRNNPAVTQYAHIEQPLRGAIRQIADYRDFLVHGCMTDWEKATRSVQFTKVDLDENMRFVSNARWISIDNMMKLTEVAINVATSINSVSTQIEHLVLMKKEGK